MKTWIEAILIVAVVAYLIFDSVWKAQFSDEDLLFHQIPPWVERP